MSTALPAAPRNSSVIDYRNGFSVPLPNDYRNGFSVPLPVTPSPPTFAAADRPTVTDIHLDGANAASRTVSVSYAAAPEPAVDMNTMASNVAMQLARERQAQLGAPHEAMRTATALESMRVPVAPARSVAPARFDIGASYAPASVDPGMSMYSQQMQNMSLNAERNHTAVSKSVQDMRVDLNAQMRRVENMQAELAAASASGGAGIGYDMVCADMQRQNAQLQSLSSEVGNGQRNISNMDVGLKGHRSSIEQVAASVSDHAQQLERLNTGMANHTEHLLQMRDGMTNHTDHLVTIREGMQNHTQHIGDMKTGLVRVSTRVCMCVCERVRACACACACVCERVRACARFDSPPN